MHIAKFHDVNVKYFDNFGGFIPNSMHFLPDMTFCTIISRVLVKAVKINTEFSWYKLDKVSTFPKELTRLFFTP